jgi:uncharacterized RDD family membrane protein YckC
MESNGTQPDEQHLFEENRYHLVQASGGKRFANYLIDTIAFYLAAVGIIFVVAYISPSAINSMTGESAGADILDRLLGLVLYGLFMFIVEAVFKGKTLGKLLTGTRAVREDGSPITAKDALLRGLSRMVPFEAFSALGTPSFPWHDKWSKTYVIDEKQSEYPLD